MARDALLLLGLDSGALQCLKHVFDESVVVLKLFTVHAEVLAVEKGGAGDAESLFLF